MPLKVTVCPGCKAVPVVGATLLTPLTESLTVGAGVGAAGDEPPQPPAMRERNEMVAVAVTVRKVMLSPGPRGLGSWDANGL